MNNILDRHSRALRKIVPFLQMAVVYGDNALFVMEHRNIGSGKLQPVYLAVK
jgi:hypothetical protein